MAVEVGPKLYKRTSTGAVQEWWQERDEGKYRTVSGQQDGAKVTSEWTTCIGKNLGRANATSPEEQARREVEANYTKKRKENYKDDISKIDERETFAPMLAKGYEDYPLKGDEDAFSQPKLDGIRCVARRDGLWSRQGNPILAVPHVVDALSSMFARNPNAIFDGELYNHYLKDDFNKIVSLVKKQKPTAADFAASEDMIQYHVYDFASTVGPFSARHQDLAAIIRQHNGHVLQLVETTKVADLGHLDFLYETYINHGYEG